MKKLTLLLACTLFINSSNLSATTVTIPLNDLIGSLGSRTMVFDAGVTFQSIQQVRFQGSGSITPGLGLGDGVECPVFPYFDLAGEIEIYMTNPNGYGCYTFIRSSGSSFGSSFNINQHLDQVGPTDLNFLLDGQAKIKATILGPVGFCIVTIQPPTGRFNTANLIIDGILAVDEPTVRLDWPNGGEYLHAGDTYTIRWQDFGDGGCDGTYTLQYSTDNGDVWNTITTDASGCSYEWQTPVLSSDQCLIQVLDNNDQTNNLDAGNEAFYVYQCSALIASDWNNDCYVNNLELAELSQSWLLIDGTGLDDLFDLAMDWLFCSNPYDPLCQ